jgi:23S rRNA pseudouridine1911/1915/1917 synthase
MQIQDPKELEPELSEPEGDEEDLFEHHRLVADIGQSLIRVDVFLSNLVRNTSRTRIKNAALSGCIRVNDIIVKPSYKVKPGDSVLVDPSSLSKAPVIPMGDDSKLLVSSFDVILVW